MYNLFAILEANVIGMVLMSVILLSSRKNKSKVRLASSKLFFCIVRMTLILCALESISFIVDGRNFFGAYALVRITNGLLIALDTIPGVLWIAYVDVQMFHDVERIKRRMRYIVVPAALVAVISIIGIFTDTFFYVTPDNVYHRSDVAIIPYMVAFGYISFATIYSYKNRKNLKKEALLPVLSFILPPIIGLFFQLFFYGTSTIWLSVSISVLIVFINAQDEFTAIDSLTGLYNRMQFEEYVNSEIKKTRATKKLTGIMIDVDNFKNINDTYGHFKGDDALKNIGTILMESAEYCDGFVARYAGDEFVIALRVISKEEVEKLMSVIKKNIDEFNGTTLEKYRLSLSIGYSIFGEVINDNMDKFLKRMDASMYREKKTKQIHR